MFDSRIFGWKERNKYNCFAQWILIFVCRFKCIDCAVKIKKDFNKEYQVRKDINLMSNLQNQLSNYIVHEEDLYEEDPPRSYPVSENAENAENDFEDYIKEEDEDNMIERMQMETRSRNVPVIQPLNISKPVSVQEIKSTNQGLNCQEHPDEVIQYYCFTSEKALCSDCLLSGKYNGCDVQSLKKAADKIKGKLGELLQEVSEKTPVFEQLEEKLSVKKDELDNFAVNFKNEVSQKLNQLRAIIDEKERSLLENIERIKDEKQTEVETHQLKIRNCQEDFSSVQSALQNKISELKDLEFCQYYLTKAKSIKGLINESGFKITEAKLVAQSGEAKGQFNLEEFQSGIQKATREVLALKGLEPKVSRGYRFSLGGLQSRNSQDFTIPEQASEFEKMTPMLKPSSLAMNDKFNETVLSANQSPFKALRKDLELISPMSMAKPEDSTPMSATDDALRKLLARVEELRKSNQQNHTNNNINETVVVETRKEDVRRTPIQSDLTSSRKELRVSSMSKISHLEPHKERDSVKKFWDTYKDLLEEQNRKKGYLTSSTKKLGELEKNKQNVFKTFIPEFSSPKGSIMSEYSSPKKKDTFDTLHNNINTLLSAKNLRNLVSDDPVRSSNKNLKYYFNKTSKSRFEENGGSISSFVNSTNKSFAPHSLTYNLKKLRKEMGYGQHDN